MKANDVFQSSFLRAPDLADGDDYKTMVVTIAKVTTSEPFDDGKTQRVLHFKETEKYLGLNKTNWNSVARITKEDDDDNWVGKRVELWVDPDVQYEGKTRPSIRIRKVSITNPVNESAKLPPLELANKASAWAAWKRQGAKGTDDDKANFKRACDIEAGNSKTPIEQFGAVQWANVAEAFNTVKAISEDDIPF